MVDTWQLQSLPWSQFGCLSITFHTHLRQTNIHSIESDCIFVSGRYFAMATAPSGPTWLPTPMSAKAKQNRISPSLVSQSLFFFIKMTLISWQNALHNPNVCKLDAGRYGAIAMASSEPISQSKAISHAISMNWRMEYSQEKKCVVARKQGESWRALQRPLYQDGYLKTNENFKYTDSAGVMYVGVVGRCSLRYMWVWVCGCDSRGEYSWLCWHLT